MWTDFHENWSHVIEGTKSRWLSSAEEKNFLGTSLVTEKTVLEDKDLVRPVIVAHGRWLFLN